MKRILITSLIALAATALTGHAKAEARGLAAPGAAKRDVLANDPDLFFVVTPDRLLTRKTRDQWLAMSRFHAKTYWEA